MALIRNARSDEVEILAAIGISAWQSALEAIGEAGSMHQGARDAFVHFVRASWVTITVIEEGGAIAGWAAREGLDEEISDFWVHPAYQRRGLGRALLDAIEARAVAQGFEELRLKTHARNAAAIAFFKAHGFSVRWLTVAYAPMLDRDVETIGLSKSVVDDDTGEYPSSFRR